MITKRKPHANNRLANLPQEDQQRLVEWLDSRGFLEVRQLAARPRPEGLGLKISHGALVRFHSRARQERALAKLAPSLPSVDDVMRADPLALANLDQSTLHFLQRKNLEALLDPDLSIVENPYPAKLAIRLMDLQLRQKYQALRNPLTIPKG